MIVSDHVGGKAPIHILLVNDSSHERLVSYARIHYFPLSLMVRSFCYQYARTENLCEETSSTCLRMSLLAQSHKKLYIPSSLG